MKDELAIVIPAYKITFFKSTLDSIADQTCKNFTLYIGDDASKDDFCELVENYKERINIVYKRFDENLGQKDLVAHWNRCIDLVRKEEWIWFFSDDDLMEPGCVELFYKHIEKHQDDTLLHFNVQVINEADINLYKPRKFRSHFSTMEFFSKRLNNKISSMGMDFIFKKKAFEKVNRFQSFDLAWSSDNATWLKLSIYNGITTIEGAMVKWRHSSLCISSISEDRNIVLRKVNANINYLKWVKLFFNQNKLRDVTSEMQKASWLTSIIAQTSALSYNEKYHLVIFCLQQLKLSRLTLRVLSLWLFRELKKNVKSLLFLNSMNNKSIIIIKL